jgi:hypothetical protein
MIKRRVAALELRLSKTAKIEDIIQVVDDELLEMEEAEAQGRMILRVEFVKPKKHVSD